MNRAFSFRINTADGTFRVATVFPRTGLYKLHADFFPVGGMPQVIHCEFPTRDHHGSNTAPRS
jgi:hypothetical protein